MTLDRGSTSEDASKMISKRFPWFLCSPCYTKWCLSLMGLPYYGEGHEDRLSDFFSEVRKASYDELCCFIPDSDPGLAESSRILHNDHWFRSFVEFVEHLPIAVYITIADEALGYPVVYANEQLEALCGHPRQEILGNKCQFFTSYNLGEMDEIARLRNGLLSSLPTRTKITCRKRNNEETPSILFCKPLYGMSTKYRFVVTVHSDVLSDDRISIMGDFLSIIPNLVNDLI